MRTFAVLTILTCLLLTLRVVEKNYRSAQSDFIPAEKSAQSNHPEQTGISGLSEVTFHTSNGLKIAGWYAPPSNHAAIVLIPGSNVDRSFILPEARILAHAGFGVLSFDWPGSGDSEGKVRWGKDERLALTAAIDWLSNRNEIDPQRIGGLGHSMGGYIMTQVAASDPRIRSVLLAATPPDFIEYVRWTHRDWSILSQLPAELAVRNAGFIQDAPTPKESVKSISPRPIFFIGGDHDPQVPEAMFRELFNAAAEPKSLWIVPGAEHGGYSKMAADTYPARLVEFFSRTLSN